MFGKSSKSKKNSRNEKTAGTFQNIQESSPESNLSKLENDIAIAIAGLDSGQNGFFCTDEPFITRFDDRQIMEYIKFHIPDFGTNPGSTAFKQAIFNFLNDDEMVQRVMDRFDLDIKDLLGFMFRIEPSTFKGMFMKKVKEIVFGKQYFCNRR